MDEYGYLYAEMPDGTVHELLADVYGNPYFGKIKVGKEIEAEGEEERTTMLHIASTIRRINAPRPATEQS